MFDQHGRFVIQEYAAARPFSSFLPGIAGPMGIPLWVFYVNRGQAITSFGLATKDHPIVEFQPANKAYQITPYTGFRTFIKILREDGPQAYEPFAPWHRTVSTRQHMCIGTNELELQETATAIGLQTNVLYFTLPGDSFAALVRRVTLHNLSGQPLDLEVVDGLPTVIPFGVKDQVLKVMARTIEAWMEVSNLGQQVPFYRLRASAGDTAQVETIQAGNFGLSFVIQEGQAQLLPAIVDPTLVFGHNTALSAPDEFNAHSLAELSQRRQITSGRTPCGFFTAALTLPPAEAVTLHTVFGHTSSRERLAEQHRRLLRPSYIRDKRHEARELTRKLTAVVATHTGSPLFDAYCRQTFLDNVLRGGWPVLLGDKTGLVVYHIYSRKHGDPERDYNAFYLAPEYYSQGNGNYRDVNQNRRNDVWFNPRVADFNVRTFLSLIQADGYNPLVVQGSQFTLSPAGRAAVLEQTAHPDELEAFLTGPFTPGQLLRFVEDFDVELHLPPDEFLSLALRHAEQGLAAEFGEGYWIDHWTYNLDLIESYLAINPERKHDLLFGPPSLPFCDSAAVVRPRARKYVLADGQPRQLEAVAIDAEKKALIASRTEEPHLVRTQHGRGPVYRTTLFAKLVCLAVVKFATMDPWGLGIEMEAGKPGWYDALNGLPGLFGSSLSETYELQRLLQFLLTTIGETAALTVSLPTEVFTLLTDVIGHLQTYNAATDPERDFYYWDAVAGAREAYREQVRLGFEGTAQAVPLSELAEHFALFLDKVRLGIARAVEMNDGLPPTYFAYTVPAYEIVTDAQQVPERDASGRPYIRALRFEPRLLPLFLEGPVHALKVLSDRDAAQRLYEQVKASSLFDRQLNMYKVNASLADQPHDIGRARAFTPGWLENESIWLHMEYKYLLEVLKAGLYSEFFEDLQSALVPFQDPQRYGRSPLENSSFIVSSAHPDKSLHGAGYVARLSGATAEFLSMWNVMLAGRQPFLIEDGQLCLMFSPALPGWLFDPEGTITFTFLGATTVVYHNPSRRDIFPDSGPPPQRITLHPQDQSPIHLPGGVIRAPHAERVREGGMLRIDVFFA